MPASVVAWVAVTDPESIGRCGAEVIAVSERHGGRPGPASLLMTLDTATAA